MERPPRPPKAVREYRDQPAGNFVPGRESRQAESLSVAFGYFAESDRREAGGYSIPVKNPTDEYYAWLADRLAEAGATIEIGLRPGSRKLHLPDGCILSAETIAAVRTHGDGLVSYLKRCRGLKEPCLERQYPKPGTVVEVFGYGDEYTVCLAEEMPANWVRWKYRGTRRYYAWTGETWEE